MEYLWSQLAAGGLLAVGQPIGGHTGSPLPPGQLSLSASQLSSLSAGQLSSLSAGPSSHLAASGANLGVTSTSSAAAAAAAAHAAYTQRMNLLNTSFTQALAAQGRCSSSADRSIWSPFLLSNRSPTNQGPFPNPQSSLGGSAMKPGIISSSSSQGGAENNRERGGIMSSSQSNGNLTCPVCLVNLKPSEVNGHFYKEIHEMETYRNALRISDMTNRDHHDHELKRRSLALADGQLTLNNKVQPCSRWQTYQRVRQNRQSRLAGLLRCKRTASVSNGAFLSPNCETNGLTSIHSPGSAASGSGFLSSSADHPYGSHPMGPGQRSSPSVGNQSESPTKHTRSSPGHRGMDTSGPRMVNGNFARHESFRDGAREAAALRDSLLRDGAAREPPFLKDGAPREGFLKDGAIIRDGIILRDGATNIDHMGHPRGLPFTFYKPWSMEGPLDKFHRGGHFGSVGGSVGSFGIENLGSFGNGNTGNVAGNVGSIGGNSGNIIGNVAGNFIGNVGSEEKDQRSNDSDMSPKRASENSDSSRTSGDVQEIRKNSSPRNSGEMTEIRENREIREIRRSETEMRMMRSKEGSSPQSASSLPPPSPLSPKRRSRSRSPMASPKSTPRSLSPKSDNDDSNISVDDNE